MICHTILVGNGTSLLDVANGKVIDAFPNVVRFNFCHIAGYEKHTGTKTDTWFTVLPYQPKHLQDLKPLSRIVVHTWERLPEKDLVLKSYEKCGPVEKLPHSIIPEICAYVKSDKYKAWSTGALAIWLFLRKMPSVHLTGFDWWERDAHHFGDNGIRGSMHKPLLEKHFVDQLIDEGRVLFL